MPRTVWSPPVFWLAAVLVLATTLFVRWDAAFVVQDSGLALFDPDTQRRLVRLHQIDASQTYPVVERLDGFPEGSISHWTLPMDWFLRALDPLARPFFEGARRYEAGAALAGPLLSLLSVAVMLLGCRCLFGPGAALLAAAFYGLAYSMVNIGWLGNGDHQNLQHLLLCVAWLLWLVRAWPAASGAALGLAVWVSTESQLMFYVFALLIFVRACIDREEADRRAKQDFVWVVGLLLAMLVGHVLEHRGDFLAFEIDKISWFQLYQVFVFALFCALRLKVACLRAPWLAWVAAVALGALPLLATGLGEAIGARVDAFASVNIWLQSEVSEFRSALIGPSGGFGLGPLLARESWLIAALPVLLAGVLWGNVLDWSRRVSLLVTACATFALEIWEAKLGHLFAMVFPLVIVAGAAGVRERWLSRATPHLRWVFAAFAIVMAMMSLPPAPSRTLIPRDYKVGYEMAGKLRRHGADGRSAVLAPWDQGAFLMYVAELPVLASAYHRNFAGLCDAYRIWLSEDDAEAHRLLKARQVGYVIAYFDRPMLVNAAKVLGRPALAEKVAGRYRFEPAAKRTLFWRLRRDASVPGFRHLFDGPKIDYHDPPGSGPLYRVWRVSD